MLRDKFGDERRTTIAHDENGDFSDEDLIGQANMLVSYSAGAYIKRMGTDVFNSQKRGGRGVKGMATKNEDEVIDLIFARTLGHHALLHQPRPRLQHTRLRAARRQAEPRAARILPMCSTFSPTKP